MTLVTSEVECMLWRNDCRHFGRWHLSHFFPRSINWCDLECNILEVLLEDNNQIVNPMLQDCDIKVLKMLISVRNHKVISLSCSSTMLNRHLEAGLMSHPGQEVPEGVVSLIHLVSFQAHLHMFRCQLLVADAGLRLGQTSRFEWKAQDSFYHN